MCLADTQICYGMLTFGFSCLCAYGFALSIYVSEFAHCVWNLTMLALI